MAGAATSGVISSSYVSKRKPMLAMTTTRISTVVSFFEGAAGAFIARSVRRRGKDSIGIQEWRGGAAVQQ